MKRTIYLLTIAMVSSTFWIYGCGGLQVKETGQNQIIPKIETPKERNGPTKLGEIMKDKTTGAIPPSGYYYIEVYAKPDAMAPIPNLQCVDQSLWSFARKFIGFKKSAAATLTVTVTPSNASGQGITVPIFITTTAEFDTNKKGSVCQTVFWDHPLSFSFNSDQNPAFDLDFVFHFSEVADITAVTNMVSQTEQLMKALGAAAGTPAALATTLASPIIKQLSEKIDSDLKDHWSSDVDLKVKKQLKTGESASSAVIDKIDFKMPGIKSSAGGVKLDEWDFGGSVYLKYSHEKFKSGGKFMGPDQIMVLPIVFTGQPGMHSQTTLQKIIVNGDVTPGFDLSTLKTASDKQSLKDACVKVRRFLASFLIPDDALAARFAVLRDTAYGSLPDLRSESNCFSSTDLTKLKENMGEEFVFQEQVSDEQKRELMIENRMNPIRTALLSQSANHIRRQVANPVSKFEVIIAHKKEYFEGDNAVAKLAENPIALKCHQARPGKDLSSIASVAVYEGKRTGAVVSFDENGKLVSLRLISPQNVADAIGIEKEAWLEPKKKSCNVDE